MLHFTVIDDRTGKPVKLRYTDELMSDLDAFSKAHCEHPTTEIRRRINANGSIAYKRQCQVCGANTTNGIAKTSIPNVENVPDADLELAGKWQAKRNAQRHVIEQKHVLLQSGHDAEWWRQYNEYLLSPEWRSRRERVMRRAGGVCEGCGINQAAQVHHLTYEHVFNEFLWELVAICEPCHKRAHADDEDEAKAEDPYAEDKARLEADNNEPYELDEPEPYEPGTGTGAAYPGRE